MSQESKGLPRRPWPAIAGTTLAVFSLTAAVACSAVGDTNTDIGPTAADAVAEIQPTQGNLATGTVEFEKVADGVRIKADIHGLSPGQHGIHVHETGDCSAPDASSAGGHFNPTSQPHGEEGDPHSHVGDLGNITADATGHAQLTLIDKQMTLTGDRSVIGKAVIVHAQADDLRSQPSGNSGARVGCGKIVPHR